MAEDGEVRSDHVQGWRDAHGSVARWRTRRRGQAEIATISAAPGYLFAVHPDLDDANLTDVSELTTGLRISKSDEGATLRCSRRRATSRGWIRQLQGCR